MKLYTDLKAPNPRRLTYFLKYKGIELDTELISLVEKENLSEHFTNINPLQTLPTLKLDDGSVLTDTIAICLYLEYHFPQKPLFGLDEVSLAQVVGWCHRIYFYGIDAVAEMFRNSNPFFADRAVAIKTPIAQNPDLVERGKIRLEDFFNELNTHLTDKKYIMGDQLTQADIDAWLVPSFAKWVSFTVPSKLNAYHDWHARVSNELKSLD